MNRRQLLRIGSSSVPSPSQIMRPVKKGKLPQPLSPPPITLIPQTTNPPTTTPKITPSKLHDRHYETKHHIRTNTWLNGPQSMDIFHWIWSRSPRYQRRDEKPRSKIPSTRWNQYNPRKSLRAYERHISFTDSPHKIACLQPANPHQVIKIFTTIVRKTAAEDIISLKMRTENLKFGDLNTLDKFFDSHDSLRLEMIKSYYPNICNEPTTVDFIILGLRNNPDFQHVIDIWYSHPPVTVHQLRASAAAIRTIHSKSLKNTHWTDSSSSTASYPNKRDTISHRYDGLIYNFQRYMDRTLPHSESQWRHPANPRDGH